MCSTGAGAMKTAATVLQELMMKRGRMPEYECIAQSGPKHQSVFEYLCIADGVTVKATARSKKDAKQAVAKRALAALAARGDVVPPPYNTPIQDFIQEESAAGGGGSGVGAASHVALLKELCEQYRLGAPEYVLVGDTGPPHSRRFTISASVGKHKFVATANNKRSARQAAADLLYHYLRDNLARLTQDFNEEEALVRAHEKAMERYVEVNAGAAAWRPNLGQTLADYHLGLCSNYDKDKCTAALEALNSSSDEIACVASALEVLELSSEEAALGSLRIYRVPRATPPLAFAAPTARAAAAAAKLYLSLALTMKPEEKTED